MELIDREHLLVDVASLKQSPWFNRGKNEQYLHGVYLERKEAVETVEDLCIKSEPPVEAIPKADYETRLKADLVAMLVELDLTIDEIPIVTRHGVTGTVMTAQGMRKKIKQNIQQKIDALKAESEG